MEDTNKKVEDTQETVVGTVNDENVLVLVKPLKFEGKNYKELDFSPFLSATYENVDTARRQAISLGVGNDYFLERSYTFAACLAAEVLELPVELFLKLSIGDAMPFRNMVYRFL